jgi:UDP-3-O-[3-hydroxymyristoyl] glucosamine N-acyltransferase
MAGQVGVADHVTIGDRATVMAKSGISGNVAPNTQMIGNPALPRRDQARIRVSQEKLPEIRKDVTRIKKHLGLEDE